MAIDLRDFHTSRTKFVSATFTVHPYGIYMYMQSNVLIIINERKEYMQEIHVQHTQQTVIRTAQNKDIEATRMYIVLKNTEHSQKQETNIY